MRKNQKTFIHIIKELIYKMSDYVRKYSLLKRLIAMIVLLIIVPNIIISFIAFIKASKTIDNETKAYSYQFVRNVGNQIDEKLAKYNNLSYFIFLNEQIREQLFIHDSCVAKGDYNGAQISKNIINNILYDLEPRDNLIMNIEIVSKNDEYTQISKDGKVKGGISKSFSELTNSQICKKAIKANGKQLWFDSLESDNMFVDQRFSNRNLFLDSCITIARSIPHEWDEDPLGIIIINISTNIFNLNNLVSDIEIENLIVADNNKVLAVLDNNKKSPILDKQQISEYINKNESTSIHKVNKNKYLITMKKIDNADWYIVSTILLDKIAKPVRDIGYMLIQACVLCIIIASIASLVVVMSVQIPLNKLIHTMNMVGDNNNILVEYEDDNLDEIAVVGKQYNRMIFRLDNLIKTVYQVELDKTNEELRRKEAEFDALQLQINPHFIYNMLEIIRWKIMELEDGHDNVSKMIEAFADLLRISTKVSNKLVTINNEITYIKKYIEIINFLFNRNIVLNTEIVNQQILDCQTVKLILQPLVENTIMHAFKNKKENNRIDIEVNQVGDIIKIIIKDNGKGMNEKMLEEIRERINLPFKTTKGIGLYNVNQRIKLAFGEQYGLNISSAENVGTTIEILQPVSTGEKEVEASMVCSRN